MEGSPPSAERRVIQTARIERAILYGISAIEILAFVFQRYLPAYRGNSMDANMQR